MDEELVLAPPEAIAVQEMARPAEPVRSAKAGFLFLWLFTVVVYARPEDMFPALGELHLTFAFGICSGLAFLVAVMSGGARVFWSRELQLVLLLTAWYIAGLPFAFWRGGSLQVFVSLWLKTLFIFFLLTQTLTTLQRIRRLLWAIILSELFVTSFSIVESSRVVWVGGRMLGVNLGMLGWNFLGIAAAVTVPYIAAVFVLRRSLVTTTLLAATFFSMLWMVVLTASRGGLLNVIFSIVLTAVLIVRDSSRSRIVGAGIVLALVCVISLAPHLFWQRLETMWTSSESYGNQVAASAQESAEDRVAVLQRSIDDTVEHPLFGLGLGNFEVARGADLGPSSAWVGTHNTFTQISSEAGIPALLLFVALLITSLLGMRRISRAFSDSAENRELNLMAKATLASLLAFVFGAFFAHLAYEYYFFYPVAIAAGIKQVANQRAAESSAPDESMASAPMATQES
jgi:O-antigen ligase